MLNALREGAKSGISKFILFGFMTFAVAGLVMMDIGGFFRSGGIRSTSIAKIAGQDLGIQQFDNTVRRVLSQQSIDPQTAYQLGFINQILESEIANNLLFYAGHDEGIRIGDSLIAEQVSSIVAPYISQNGLTAKEAFRRILMSQNMTEGQFTSSLRREIVNTLLRTSFQAAVAFTPEQEARDIYRYQNESRTIQAVMFPNNAVKDYQEPTDEVLLPFYQAAQERYAIPETRNFTVAVLTQDSLRKTMDISDEELKTVYEKHIGDYTLPERRVMEQAVLGDEKAAAAVAKRIEKGASLKDAVKQETGSADAYLGEQEFQQNGLVEDIGKAAFSAEKGAAVGPIKTALGWHVLIVRNILPVQVQPFEKIKAELRKEELQTRLADQLFATAGMIDDQLAGGAALEEVVESMDLSVTKLGPVREDGSTPDDKEGMKTFKNDAAAILQTAFELTEDESSPVMELQDGSFAVVRIDSIEPRSYKPFDTVKADLKKLWVEDQQQVLNKQKAQEALRALAAGEKDLAAIARESGFKTQNYTMKRNDKPEEPFSGPAKTKFFEIEKGAYAIAASKDGLVVGTVTQMSLPDPDKIKKEDLADTADIAAKGTTGEIFLSYLGHLREKYNVKINERLLQATYGPGTEQSGY